MGKQKKNKKKNKKKYGPGLWHGCTTESRHLQSKQNKIKTEVHFPTESTKMPMIKPQQCS